MRWPESSSCSVRCLGHGEWLSLVELLTVPLTIDGEDEMNAFPARYRDVCFPCGQSIEPGDSITNHPDHGYIHEDCSWDADRVPQMSADERTRPDHTPVTMPRGKTAKDRCDRCFMVHSTEQVDCE